MNDSQVIQIAIREITRQYRETKRNVMATPRAEELRAEKMAELLEAMNYFLTVQASG